MSNATCCLATVVRGAEDSEVRPLKWGRGLFGSPTVFKALRLVVITVLHAMVATSWRWLVLGQSESLSSISRFLI